MAPESKLALPSPVVVGQWEGWTEDLRPYLLIEDAKYQVNGQQDRPVKQERRKQWQSRYDPSVPGAGVSASKVFATAELLESIIMISIVDLEREGRWRHIWHLDACRLYRVILGSPELRGNIWVPTVREKYDPKQWEWTREQSEAYIAAGPFPKPPAKINPWLAMANRDKCDGWYSGPWYCGSWALNNIEYRRLATHLPGAEPCVWTLSYRFSRGDFARLPKPDHSRDMLVTNPPIEDFWTAAGRYTLRHSWEYEPIMEEPSPHLAYDPGLPKRQQAHYQRRPRGGTLGDISPDQGDVRSVPQRTICTG